MGGVGVILLFTIVALSRLLYFPAAAEFFRQTRMHDASRVVTPAAGEINSNGRLTTAINAIPIDSDSSFM